MMDRLAQVAKAAVALLLTVLWLAVGEGLVSDEYLPWARVAFAAAVTYGVWRVPNREAAHAGG